MSRVEEIEAAILALPPQEYLSFVEWFREREHARWDEQMDLDFASGKMDFLFEEVDRESAQGILRDWPSPK